MNSHHKITNHQSPKLPMGNKRTTSNAPHRQGANRTMPYRMLHRTCLHSFLFLLLFQLPAIAEAFCPTGCICNDITVDCTNADLDVIPILLNPMTVTITLANNRISSLQESLIFYTDLTSLDLSSNELPSLGARNFKGQRVLKTLFLNDNRLTSLQVENFFGLSSLEYLTLNNNQLTYIDHDAFKGLDSLQSLYLERNRIKDISNSAFEGLSSIKSISLMSNKLTSLPSNGISKLKTLEELNFSDNRISSVPASAFHLLQSLSFLDLSRNNISLVHPNAFLGLEKLRILSLRDNRLSVLPSTAFPPLGALYSLDLGGNLFSTIPRDFLGHLSSLHVLRIERCPRLGTISQDAFVSGWSLQELSLSQNPRLRVLPPAALAPLLALKKLDLSSCGLETLQPTQVPMRALSLLELSGNPLHCNCSLVWLARVASNATFAPGLPSCAAPPKLYGVAVRDLGAGTCGPTVSPWTIAGCVGVAFSGAITILAFLICRWKKNRSPPTSPTTANKPFQICNEGQTSLNRQGDFTLPPNDPTLLQQQQQVYSSPSYYTASAPQFLFPPQTRALHSCPSDCSCIRQSPALRPLLRSNSSTPTHTLNNPQQQHPSPQEYPPPPPSRPPPTIAHLHYQYSPHYLVNNHLRPQLPSPGNLNNLNGPSAYGTDRSGTERTGPGQNPQQLLSPDWLYGQTEDKPHHWYASIDGSSSSAGAGNESSGYWDEDKELPTTTLLPVGMAPRKPLKENNERASEGPKEVKDVPAVVKDAVPTSYI